MLLERAGLAADEGQVAFDETSPEVRALMDRVAPICEALYLVMVADGESDAGEIKSIRGALVTLTAGGLSSRAVDSMLGGFEAAVAEQGWQERLMQVAGKLSADREDAEATLALAAAVAMADGSVASAEETLLVELSEWLGISRKRAAVILDTAD